MTVRYLSTIVVILATLSGCMFMTPKANAIGPGIYKIRTAAKCIEVSGSYVISTNFQAGCAAEVEIWGCAPAADGTCDCVAYPEDGGAGGACDDIVGGGQAQDVVWR